MTTISSKAVLFVLGVVSISGIAYAGPATATTNHDDLNEWIRIHEKDDRRIRNLFGQEHNPAQEATIVANYIAAIRDGENPEFSDRVRLALERTRLYAQPDVFWRDKHAMFQGEVFDYLNRPRTNPPVAGGGNNTNTNSSKSGSESEATAGADANSLSDARAAAEAYLTANPTATLDGDLRNHLNNDLRFNPQISNQVVSELAQEQMQKQRQQQELRAKQVLEDNDQFMAHIQSGDTQSAAEVASKVLSQNRNLVSPEIASDIVTNIRDNGNVALENLGNSSSGASVSDSGNSQNVNTTTDSVVVTGDNIEEGDYINTRPQAPAAVAPVIPSESGVCLANTSIVIQGADGMLQQANSTVSVGLATRGGWSASAALSDSEYSGTQVSGGVQIGSSAEGWDGDTCEDNVQNAVGMQGDMRSLVQQFGVQERQTVIIERQTTTIVEEPPGQSSVEDEPERFLD